jgi:rubrerythrin
MATRVEMHEQAAPALVAGVRAKGEYSCSGCGYGVTIYRELPRCPMCGAGLWEQTDWSPFHRRVNPGIPG